MTTTSLVDAEPVSSSPSNLPTLTPGDYQVVLEQAAITSRQCLQDRGQHPAWDCASGARMEFNIKSFDSKPMVFFNHSDPDSPLDSTLSNVRLGAQPPILNDYTIMSLMNAKDHMDKGPAYVFHKQFDKLVILPENAFDPPSQSWRQRRGDNIGTNSTLPIFAERGDKPWFCYWNGTLLEGFIFVYQALAIPNDTTPIVERDYPVPSETSTVPISVTPAAQPTAFILMDPLASSTDTSATSASSATSDSSATSASSTVIPLPAVDTPPPPEGTPVATSGSKLDADVIPNDGQYPAVIKIEERGNLENGVPPYCQQMLIMEDGTVQSAGLPVIHLTVDESGGSIDASSTTTTTKKKKKKRDNQRRGEEGNVAKDWLGKRGDWDEGACSCEWLLDGS